ncbi:MAG: ABC transporter substrate-binding protein [Spirochaetia bacterium]|nr:ABC transporter substrate-binding protein [Spirochaetia bacterium]
MMRKSALIMLVLLFSIPALLFAAGEQELEEEKTLEIFSWWTAGGEAEGLQALIDVFDEKYPEIEVVNATVAGGAGTNAKAVLATRMQGGNPPDAFQVHAGHELIDTWVVSDYMEPVTFVLEDNDWMDVFPEDVIDIISYQGEVYSIPVNIHRSNVMWYNADILNEHGLSVPDSMDEFFEVAEELQKNDITALALGDTNTWPATHLLASVILASTGPEKYKGLWEGTVDWSDADVKEALENYAKMMDYVNSDHAALTNMDAAGYVAEGKAAMNVMGDWVAGYYMSQGYTQGEDWDWAPSPGTAGNFIMLSDSFGLTKNAPNRENVVKWLEVCASKDGQDAFNPIKGSIPARTDSDRSKYNSYQLAAMDDFSSDVIVPSLAHGSAVSEAWLTKINDVMSVFTTELDVNKAMKEFQSLADRYAPANK